MDKMELAQAQKESELYIKIPLSKLKFSCPVQQQKFEKRMADEEDRTQLISEIEDIFIGGYFEITI